MTIGQKAVASIATWAVLFSLPFLSWVIWTAGYREVMQQAGAVALIIGWAALTAFVADRIWNERRG